MNETENRIELMLYDPKVRVSLLLILGLIGLLFIWTVRSNSSQRRIKPFVATVTPAALRIDAEPLLVEFADLEDDPVRFRNQRIEVTGLFSPLALPDCRAFSGPKVAWGLIDETLLMNAVGFEKIVRPLPFQLEMRVVGIWRFYPGAVGCGKEPQNGRGMWYLEVKQILQPNPLPIVANAGVLQIVSGNNSAIELLPGDVTTIGSGQTGGSSDDSSQTPNAGPGTPDSPETPSGIIISTLTPTPPSNATVTASPSTTPTSRATAASGETTTPTATATITSTPSSSEVSPTPTQPNIGPPPAPTATPGGAGYPPGGVSTPYP